MGKSKAEMYRKQFSEHFKYATKFRDPTLASTTSTNSSSKFLEISPSKNHIENQSKVIPNAGDNDSASKHVNHSKIVNNSGEQYSSKSADAIPVAAEATSEP